MYLFLSAPGPWSVELGLLESISHPGGNLTGVQGVDCIPKALEFLKEIIPDIKRVYLPCNPDDVVSTGYLPGLNKAASQLGVELVLHKIHSVEEVVTAIENLTADVKLIINLKTAEEIGIHIPDGVLAQANEIIR